MRLTFTEAQDFDIPAGLYTATLWGSGVIMDHNQDVLWIGGGAKKRFTFRASGDYITIAPDNVMVLDIPALRSLDHDGWINEPSLTDLSPKPFGMVSPEVQAVIDMMNKNAIIREQRMLKALQQRQ